MESIPNLKFLLYAKFLVDKDIILAYYTINISLCTFCSKFVFVLRRRNCMAADTSSNLLEDDIQKNDIQHDDAFAESSDIGISEDDRREVLKSIENITSENTASLTEDAFVLKGAKSGILFPVLVNLVAFIVVAVVIFLLGRAFQNDSTTIARTSIEFSSLEGQLLRELQKQSQDQISAKEQEIQNFEQRLTGLEEQRQSLSENLLTRIDSRKSEYDELIIGELGDLQATLEREGRSEAEIIRLLAARENALRAFYAEQLALYEEELLNEQAELENNIAQLQGEYSTELTGLKSERDQLLDDLRVQESNLRAELEQQSQALADSDAIADNLQNARDTLSQLTEERQAASGIEDQLLGLFERLQAQLVNRNWENGLPIIRQIQTFLNEERVVSLGALANRRASDLFVISIIEDYIQNALNSEETVTSLTDQLEVLNRIRSNNERANNALRNNNEELASEIYNETFTLMPELRTANNILISDARDALNQQFANELDTRTKAVSDLVQAAEQAMRDGNYTLALNNFDSALQVLPELEENVSLINDSLIYMGYAAADQVVNDNLQAVNAIIARTEIDTAATVTAINEQIQAAVLERESELLVELSDTNELTESYETQISGLNEELADVNARRDELQQFSTELQAEIDDLQKIKQQLESIQNKYAEYRIDIDAIRRTAEDSNGFQNRQALENFVGSRELEAVFPALRTEIRSNYKTSEDAGRQDGISLARDVVVGFANQATPAQQLLYLETEREYSIVDGNGALETFLTDLLDVLQ